MNYAQSAKLGKSYERELINNAKYDSSVALYPATKHKLSVNITVTCYTLKLYNRDVPGKSVHNVRSVMSVVG